MWIAAYVLAAWLVASLVMGGLLALFFGGAKAGLHRSVGPRPVDGTDRFVPVAGSRPAAPPRHTATGWPTAA
jgi:hypothetical protein